MKPKNMVMGVSSSSRSSFLRQNTLDGVVPEQGKQVAAAWQQLFQKTQPPRAPTPHVPV